MEEARRASPIILRLGLLALGSWLLWVGFQIFPASSGQVVWLFVAFAVYLAAFVSLVTAAVVSRRGEGRARAWVLVATLLGVIAWFAVDVTVYHPRYRADTMVLSHIAAEQALRGRNPYTLESASLTADVERLGFPVSALTQTADGMPFTRVLAYPALHVLVFMPALAAGLGDLRWIVLGFELTGLWLLWRHSPRWIQPVIFVPFWVNPDLFVVFTSE